MLQHVRSRAHIGIQCVAMSIYTCVMAVRFPTATCQLAAKTIGQGAATIRDLGTLQAARVGSHRQPIFASPRSKNQLAGGGFTMPMTSKEESFLRM